MTTVLHQSVGFFDDPNRNNVGIMPLQTVVSDPSLPTLASATGMLSPDCATESRMSHFDDRLYDLRPESHLSRFCKVVLGDAGAGQLRKRYTMARLQTTMEGTHFYDLDAFWGSLLSARRSHDEELPCNPMTDSATPDQWDDIAMRDSRYRERLYALAKSLPMTGTVPGLQQAAEALTGVECDVYETWKLLENNISIGTESTLGRIWGDDLDVLPSVEDDFDQWKDFEITRETWNSVENRVEIGRTGVSNGDEVIIRPKRDYAPDQERLRQEDEMNVQRALNVLKPAGVLLTVDNRGLSLHIPTRIASMMADSNFWEVLTKVRPRPGLSTTVSPYPTSSVRVSAGVIGDGVLSAPPRPPLTTSQGHQWSYNSLIVSVTGLAIRENATAVSGSGTVINPLNWETVPINRMGGLTEHVPKSGISDQRALLAAQAAADSVIQAHPYSGPRVVVPPHG